MTLTDKQKGVIFILISAAGFAIMNLFVRLSGDIPSIQKSFFRNFVAFIIALIYLLNLSRKGNAIRIPNNKKQWGVLMLRSIFGTLGIIANFYTIDKMPVADASVLNKLAPFFVVLLSFIFLQEKMNKSQVFGLVTAFVGVIFIANPSFSGIDLKYYIIGTLGGFCAGAAYTCLRPLGKWGVNGSFIVSFFALISCLTTLPSLIFNYHPMTGTQLILLLLTGAFAAVGQYGVTFAYRFAPGKEISIYDYSNVVLTALLGFLFLGEIPHTGTAVGSMLVFVASLVMYVYNKRENIVKTE